MALDGARKNSNKEFVHEATEYRDERSSEWSMVIARIVEAGLVGCQPS